MRRGLQRTADAASLVAASQLDTDRIYVSGGVGRHIDTARALSMARSVTEASGLALHLDLDVTEDRVRAVVRASLDTSFLSLVGVGELPVAAEATAVPVFGE
jgi:hypothetical protein